MKGSRSYGLVLQGHVAPSLEDIIQAAMAAPADRREAAFQLLRGELPRSEPYLSLANLSRRTGFSTKSLHRWQVPKHDIGGNLRYRESEVLEYFKSDAFKRRQAALRAERKQGLNRATVSTNGGSQ
jgi:hypothetical protein